MSERHTEGGSTPRGRPRSPQADTLIRDAALALLRGGGPAAVNIDAVASASGVARTTIYRRYSSRQELLGAVIEELVDARLPAPELPVPEKLRWLLGHVHDVLEEGIGRGGTAALLLDSDPEFTGALRERMVARLATLAERMAGDVRAGRLRAGVDPDALVGVLLGAYLAEVVRHGELRPDWVDRTVELLAPAVTPR